MLLPSFIANEDSDFIVYNIYVQMICVQQSIDDIYLKKTLIFIKL